MKAFIRPLLVANTALLLINWGNQDNSMQGTPKPAINFYGTVQDNTKTEPFAAQNITIAGQYRQIPVHPLPQTDVKNPHYDPNINTVRLDFSEISKITVPNPHSKYTFKNREYIAIRVESNDNQMTTNDYIIELNKKVYCDQTNAAGPIERELSFEAIETITFNGHRTQELDTRNEISGSSQKRSPLSWFNKIGKKA